MNAPRLTFDPPRYLPGVIPGKPWVVVKREWLNGWNYFSTQLWFEVEPVNRVHDPKEKYETTSQP